MSHGSSRSLALVPLALLVLASIRPSAASADYRADFADGVKAYDQKRWDEVVDFMRKAIAARPNADPDKIAIFSTRFVSYVPHTFLGIALARLDRCEEAVPLFEVAERQRVAPDRAPEYYAEMVAERERCLAQLVERGLGRATAAVATAQGARDTLLAALEPPGARALVDLEPALRERRAVAESALQAAIASLERGAAERDFLALRHAAEAAQSAQRDFASISERLERERESGLLEELASVLGALEDGEAALAKPPIQTPAGTAEGTRLLAEARALLVTETRDLDRETLARVRLLAQQARELAGASSRVAADRPRDDPQRPSAQPPPSAGTEPANAERPTQSLPAVAAGAGEESALEQVAHPPPALLAGLEAYLEADYARVLSLLEPSRLDQGRAAAHAHLLRAAALFARQRTDAGGGDEVSEAIDAELRAARRASADLLIPEAFFSPLFVARWRAIGAERP